MSLLTCVQRAARQCGLTPPTVVLSSGDEGWLQFAEWAQEIVDDLALRHDWHALHKTQTITGDGVAKSFNLASDFGRLSKMPAVSRVGSTAGFWPSGPVSPPAFIGATTLPIQSVRPTFQIENGQISFDQAPGTTDSYTISYQSAFPIKSSGSGVELWATDSDVPYMPERCVRLGIVWMWKASKGLPYAEFMDSYERTFESLASADWGLIALETATRSFEPDYEFGEPRVNT